MKTIIVAILLVLLCCSTITSASPALTTVSISPASKILVVNDTLTITFYVTPGQEVDTVGIDLIAWNKNVFDCINIYQGNLFPNPLVWINGKINNSAGTITWSVFASNIPIHTPGIYCNITFKAKASGISTIAIGTGAFSVVRNGSYLPKQVLNSCQITVEDLYAPPINPPTNQTNTTNTTNTNTTINPPDNDSVPKDNEPNITPPGDWFAPNETYIPIQNETENENTTDKEKISPGLFDNIPPTTIIYAIIAIILISVFAYIIVRHFQYRQEDKEDEESEDNQGFTEDDGSGYTGGSGEPDDVWG